MIRMIKQNNNSTCIGFSTSICKQLNTQDDANTGHLILSGTIFVTKENLLDKLIPYIKNMVPIYVKVILPFISFCILL